jgi:hypothetical protein
MTPLQLIETAVAASMSDRCGTAMLSDAEVAQRLAAQARAEFVNDVLDDLDAIALTFPGDPQ